MVPGVQSSVASSSAGFPYNVIRLRRRPQKSPQTLHSRRPVQEDPREISFEGLRSVFHLPISKAAKQLDIGVTVLKKYCRWYCIDRWPYRKIQSVDKLLTVMSELQLTATTGEVMRELLTVRNQLVSEPTMDLDDNIRRLRQAVFKWQYKQRQQPF